MYGSFVVNIWTEKGHPYLFVRQPQSELPVSSRQSELCPCECKLERNISVRHRGDLNVISGEDSFLHVDNEKEHMTLQSKFGSKFHTQDKRFLKKLHTTNVTHDVNLNVTSKNSLQETRKSHNFSRETRAPQSSNNLRNLPATLYKLAPSVSFNGRSLV